LLLTRSHNDNKQLDLLLMRSSRITLVFASFHGNTTAEQQLVQQFKGKVNLPEKEIGKNDVD